MMVCGLRSLRGVSETVAKGRKPTREKIPKKKHVFETSFSQLFVFGNVEHVCKPINVLTKLQNKIALFQSVNLFHFTPRLRVESHEKKSIKFYTTTLKYYTFLYLYT